MGLAVSEAIDQDEQTDFDTSVLTQCNDFPHSTFFPANWILDSPDLWGEPPSGAHSGHQFVVLLMHWIEHTDASLDLAMLQTDEEVLPTVLAPAVRSLNERIQDVRPQGPYPLVRFIQGFDLAQPSPQDVYAAVADALGPKPWYVHFAVARYLGTQGWQHAKTIVRDRRYAIAGGHILTMAPLEIIDPMADISIQLEGDAARATSHFMDYLWQQRTFAICSWGNCSTLPPSAAPPPPASHGAHNVFALSRGFLHQGEMVDFSGDDAIFAAFEAAHDSIHLVQHSINLCEIKTPVPCTSSDHVAVAIILALMRGIDVRLVLGAPEGQEEQMRQQYDRLDETMETVMVELNWEQSERDAAHCRFEVAPYRSWDDPDDRLESHAKFFIVDGRAFYVGSQNLYPSGIRTSGYPINHVEYGFFVDDAALTAELEGEYWDRLWSYASPYVFPSQFVEREECPEPSPVELCDGVDNDDDGQIDEGDVCDCRVALYQGRFYRFCDTPVDWITAVRACGGQGGALVRMHDTDENAWLAAEGAPLDRWIGPTDRDVEGDWRWLDNSGPSEFLGWGPGEPDGGSGENCGLLDSGASWNSEWCPWPAGFVCEMPSWEQCNGLDDDGDGYIDEDGICDCRTVLQGASEYLFCDELATWYEAERACSAAGSHLVKIQSEAENSWLAVEAAPLNRWTGLTDAAVEGAWRWVDGTLLGDDDFQGWGPFEPGGGTFENCTQFYPADTHWNDLACGWTNPFVCEAPSWDE